MKRGISGIILAGLIIGLSITLFPARPRPRVLTGHETVTIFGSVARQGKYDYKPGMTVTSLIRDEAAGFAQFAQKRKIRVFNKNILESPLHKLHVLVSTACESFDRGLNRTWEVMHLPGGTPQINMAKPDPSARAVVNFEDNSTDVVLEPDDVVIVPEKILNL